jgi:hypothetical protein
MQMKKMISSVKHVQPVMLDNVSFKEVMNKVDDAFKKQMKSCYTKFNCITKPILSRRQIMTLVSIYKTHLPNHYKLMKEVLGFHLKENQMRNIHLHESSYYDRLLFLSIFAAIKDKKLQAHALLGHGRSCRCIRKRG